MFYKADSNGVTAIAIAGRTRIDLDRRTKAVGADLDTCSRESGLCLVLPRQLGLNPYLVVNANGADITVPPGSTVSAALRAAGIPTPASVLPTLRVSRMYQSQPVPIEFDRNDQSILGVTLMGLERLTW